MKTKDFETAIEALSADIETLRIKQEGGKVTEAYGRLNLIFIKWDEFGRAFSHDQDPREENCISTDHLPYLDYRRDADFDLTF